MSGIKCVKAQRSRKQYLLSFQLCVCVCFSFLFFIIITSIGGVNDDADDDGDVTTTKTYCAPLTCTRCVFCAHGLLLDSLKRRCTLHTA